MTPEKFLLLRDWVRSEIQSAIIKDQAAPLAPPAAVVLESDRTFLRVVQAFCGGQSIL
jgi:hypothetical protein